MGTTLECRRCSGRRIIKNGFLRGEQRYRCKDCCYNFVDQPKSERPVVRKVLAILLYNLGLSLRATGKFCGVSGTTVLNWVDDFAEQHATKPAPPKDGVIVVELDEMHHYLKKNPINSGSGKLIVVIQASWLTGNAAIVTRTL
jgi:transposase-like protein